MDDISDCIIDEFLKAAHETARCGLVRCSSGNLSLRLDAQRFLATASGSWLAELTRQQLSVCRLADGALLDGPGATVEIGFHAGILKARPDVNVVMHFQTPFATTLACRPAADINYSVIPEIPSYMGPVATIPYFPPGSPELAQAVTTAMRDHDMGVMANHGEITVAKDWDQAIRNAEFFELACQIIVQNGYNPRILPQEEVKRLFRLKSGDKGV